MELVVPETSVLHWWLLLNFFFFLIFGGTGVWLQGLALARQVLSHLSYSPSPFCFSYFLDRLSHFCLGLALHQDPPTCTSQITEITRMYNHSQIVCWEGDLTFFPDWPWTAVPPISTFLVDKITDICHLSLPDSFWENCSFPFLRQLSISKCYLLFI
jgi:hypothetical protein